MFAKFPYLLLIEFPEGNAPGHQDGGRLGDPEDLPAETLEEGGEMGLAGGLAAWKIFQLRKIFHNFSLKIFYHRGRQSGPACGPSWWGERGRALLGLSSCRVDCV